MNYFAYLLYAYCTLMASGQTSATNTAADDALLDRMIAANVLTTPGAPPFHAILEITSESSSSTEHHGRIEVFWEDPTSYSLKLDTPEFGQTLIVSGDQVQESDSGDFYPGWVQNFVAALLDPMARAKDLRGHPNAYNDFPAAAAYCIKRDDRRNGITDDLTFAQVCYNKSLGTNLSYTLDFTHYLGLENFRQFHEKSIAHTYHTSTRDDTKLQGVLTTLEDWKPDRTLLTITNPTAPSGRILTSIVSTATEESLVQVAPKDIHWPPVREGRLEGYLIVHAITDRTGQVREASPYNSDDNRELAPFDKQVAMQYKFKPFLVDGVPRQMEMPLVLHFTTTAGEPIPELNDAQTRKLITGCDLPHEISDPPSAGQQIEIIFSVNAEGHMGTVGSSDRKIPVLSLFRRFQSCKFGLYSQKGKVTQYHAHLSVKAQ
ncbi:hypothetical protein FTW19_12380 [Terriglobus albidus]|uniref:TonB C-terminal domain-containing protein n=1 Tax=Terriglobus albidus TaxID=1592106 RepID=A0A5B9EF77_9BACT|nr:hypothetical protein [Terriglobus albidus]QEE28726.1 hypothetical protein FTW19_12380 [Terriglobus albidus]